MVLSVWLWQGKNLLRWERGTEERALPKKEVGLRIGSQHQVNDSFFLSTNMGNEHSQPHGYVKLPKIKFRVLIIGRANAGKTSILQKVCDTTDSPVIYRRTGGDGEKKKKEKVRGRQFL